MATLSPPLAPEPSHGQAPDARVTSASANTLSTENVLGVLDGWFGVSAGLYGAVLIAVVTVVERSFVVPKLYESASDLVLHISAEIVAGGLLWLALRAGMELALRAARVLPADPRGRWRIGLWLSVLVGVAVGYGLFLFIVRPSSRVAILPVPVWLLSLSLLGSVLSGVGLFLVSRPVPKHAGVIAALLTAGALWLHLSALHRYLRHYGNLHSLILAGVTFVVAFACGLVLYRTSARGRTLLGAAAVALVVAASLALAVMTPSYSARSAVLVWGGVAKRLLVAAAWPLLDRDGDGAPAVLWGMDPDDDDRTITALAPHGPRSRPETPLAITKLSTRRNVLWILVDTVRLDSFERVRTTPIGSSLEQFAYFAGYRSCSSRTAQVVSQIFGSDRCDRRRVVGLEGRSLLETLALEGFHTQLFGYFDLPLPFAAKEVVRNDDTIVERAQRAIAEPTKVARAIVVHLKGGHGPYDVSGSSERERYEASLDASFARVARLLESVPSDWAVVVLGDHGEEFGEHASHAHATTLYQEVLRTPLLVRAPGFTAGRHEDARGCPSVPWMTLVAAGILPHAPEPLPFQYAALDIARGEFGHLRDSHLRSLEQSGLKVIWSPGFGIWELYDLKNDPGETRNLATQKPEVLRELGEELMRLSLECGHLPLEHGSH